MFQSDYILRVIEQLGTMVRRMLDALREARPDDTLDLSEEALGLALDIDPDTALSLTGEGLLTFMGAGSDPDPVQVLIVGETLLRRAQARMALGDSSAAVLELERARTVLRAVASCGEGEQMEKAEELLGEGMDLRL